MFPCGHCLRIVCRQQVAPQGGAEQSPAQGHLNLADDRRIQATGRVKNRATLRIGLKNAIQHDAVKM